MSTLTKKEVQVLRLLMAGFSNAKIAIELGIKIATVKYHLTNIYKKEKVCGDRELMAKLLVPRPPILKSGLTTTILTQGQAETILPKGIV